MERVGDKVFIILGILGTLIAYICIGLSIYLSPSFSWFINALSDLGHAQKSNVAPIFNSGLLLSGFLVALYSARVLLRYAKYTGVSLLFSSLLLQAVAAFDEIYGRIHFIVSVLFFVSAGLSCIIYSVERGSVLAASAFLIGLLSWVLWWMDAYEAGIAVPETISALAVSSCIIHSAIMALRSLKIKH
ncbi:MAG: DUF998 domain-containing protein [Candidatus Bathyarchaeia archaeon]|nr:DUF998 domain-containing protein [Candidatus Bathyarchaeota archaeon]